MSDSASLLKQVPSFVVERDRYNPNKADIIIQPLQPGVGMTLAVALRRTMSYISGDAIVSCAIDGISHEFSAIDGVREDVCEIILNLKMVVLKLNAGVASKTIRITASGPGSLTAGMLGIDNGVTVLNEDLVICHLEDDITINMTLEVRSGVGYMSASVLESEKGVRPIGVIYLDASFCPVKKVAYSVNSSRVGNVIDYDKLTMTVETNGVITPRRAVDISAAILRGHLSVFEAVDDDRLGVDSGSGSSIEDDLDFDRALFYKIEDLELSVRSQNCLKCEQIVYVGDLVQKTESEMLKTPNFGRKSLNEIRQVLANMNLRLGMVIPSWPPENVSDLYKKFSDSSY